MRSKLAVLPFLAFVAFGQSDRINPQSTMDITFPEDSPVTVLSANWGDSSASPRGGAMLLDLHTSLSLRNSSQRRIRGITLLVKAQEVTPGGKASISVPSLNVAPGESFPIRIDLRLMRPLQTGNGAMVHVGLDGVLFDDLSFYGPNTLNSRRSMIVWELEARRDRQYFRQVMERAGAEELRKVFLESLGRQTERGASDARMAHAGRSTNAGNDHSVQFAFLEMPNAPVDISPGKAMVAGDEIHSPKITMKNLSDRPIRSLEVGWVVKDQHGKQFVAASTPLDVALEPHQAATVVQDGAFKLSQGNGQPIFVGSMTGFVNSIEFSDGRLWIPERSGKVMTASPEEQRLSELYRSKGLNAVMEELRKF